MHAAPEPTQQPDWVLSHEGYNVLTESAVESCFALGNGFRHACRSLSTNFLETLPDGIHKVGIGFWRRLGKNAHHRHRPLLRVRAERPSGRRTVEKPDPFGQTRNVLDQGGCHSADVGFGCAP